MSKAVLVAIVEQGHGQQITTTDRVKKIYFLAAFGEIATVKLTVLEWIDYMRFIKMKGEWSIINVVWMLKEKK